ncbi:MAG TPA: hypothetical protein VGB19_04935 [Actinomycetota bacterium]
MKTDDRDERLAALLDDAVAGVDPGIDRRLREVRRRGTRRRFVELASVLTVVAVLVGAVAVTAVSRRSNHEPSHERTTWTAVGGPEAGWRIRYPSTWHLTETDDSGCAGTPVRRGAFISNLPFDWHHPDGTATGTCNGGRWVFAGFPSDGIALEIEPVGHMHGIFPPQPDTAFPIHKGDLDRGHGIRGGPAHWYETVWRNGVWLMNVRLYVGVDVTSADRGASERTLESLRLDLPPAKPSRPAVPTTCGTPPQAVGRVGEPLRGDVDGDGSSDRVMLLRKGQPKGACRFVVEAITGSGRSAVSAQVDQSEPDPFLLGLAALRSEPGLQVVVKVDSGAAYYFFRVFTWDPGSEGLVPVTIQPPMGPWSDLLASGSSLGTGATGVSCRGGSVVVTTVGKLEGIVPIVMKSYRLAGSTLVLDPSRTRRFHVPAREITRRFPHLTGYLQDFGGCLVAG